MIKSSFTHIERSIESDRSAKTQIAPADVFPLQIIITVLSIVVVVALLPFVSGLLWLLYRRRAMRQQVDSNDESIGLMVIESAAPVGLGIRHSPSSEQKVVDIETRYSAETILSPKSPRHLSITPSVLGLRNNMLGRRGKSPLECDTTAQYAIDAALTGSIVPKSCPDLAVPDKQLQLLPVYGFTEATITPPIGSPLWRRNPDSAGVAESPRRIMRSKLSSRGPVTFSELVERSMDTAGDAYDSVDTVTVASPLIAVVGRSYAVAGGISESAKDQ